MTNEMRKLMEALDNVENQTLQDIREVHGDAYVAAYLYRNPVFGVTKPEMARILSKEVGIDYKIAEAMIDAIDAYEDIRESDEFRTESINEGMFGGDVEDAFVSGYDSGYDDCVYGEESDPFKALDRYRSSRRG